MEHWYRYEDVQYAAPLDEYERPIGSGTLKVEKRVFEVVKTTPKGVWLRPWFGDFSSIIEPRFVRLSARKRYACPTEAEALESFIARKEAQARIYESRANRARRAVAMARRLHESAQRASPTPKTVPAFA